MVDTVRKILSNHTNHTNLGQKNGVLRWKTKGMNILPGKYLRAVRTKPWKGNADNWRRPEGKHQSHQPMADR
jgi:hypothetical protein